MLFRSEPLAKYLSSKLIISAGTVGVGMEKSDMKSLGLRFQANDTCVPSAEVMRTKGGLTVVAGMAARESTIN